MDLTFKALGTALDFSDMSPIVSKILIAALLKSMQDLLWGQHEKPPLMSFIEGRDKNAWATLSYSSGNSFWLKCCFLKQSKCQIFAESLLPIPFGDAPLGPQCSYMKISSILNKRAENEKFYWRAQKRGKVCACTYIVRLHFGAILHSVTNYE